MVAAITTGPRFTFANQRTPRDDWMEALITNFEDERHNALMQLQPLAYWIKAKGARAGYTGNTRLCHDSDWQSGLQYLIN